MRRGPGPAPALAPEAGHSLSVPGHGDCLERTDDQGAHAFYGFTQTRRSFTAHWSNGLWGWELSSGGVCARLREILPPKRVSCRRWTGVTDWPTSVAAALAHTLEVQAGAHFPQVLKHVPGVGDRCHLDRNYTFRSLGGFADRPDMHYVLTSQTLSELRFDRLDSPWVRHRRTAAPREAAGCAT